MINVLHVVLSLQVGGLERVVIDLINNQSSDINSYVVCLEEQGELEAPCRAAGIYVLHKRPGLSMGMIRQLYCLIRKLEINLIHTHNPVPHFYGSLAGFSAGIPIIHTKHGRNFPNEARKVWLNRISSLLTSKIVAVSRNAAEVSLDIEKIPASKLMVILNGVNIAQFNEHVGTTQKNNTPVRIGIVARLSAEKDHHTLLKACEVLAENKTDFHLNIIGDGPLRGELEQTVRNLKLDRHVTFLGMRHDIPALLEDLDIFTLSSTTEGISITLLEAMASSLPIVATNVGGNPEVVVDGTTGFIVPPEQPEALAEKLSLLIHDRTLRTKMGQAGRERVIEKFDMRQAARHYELLYREVLCSKQLHKGEITR